jgi:hypothetical protein
VCVSVCVCVCVYVQSSIYIHTCFLLEKHALNCNNFAIQDLKFFFNVTQISNLLVKFLVCKRLGKFCFSNEKHFWNVINGLVVDIRQS